MSAEAAPGPDEGGRDQPRERVARYLGQLPGRAALIDAAAAEGCRLYLVGGAVRDLLLGASPDARADVDIAVEGDVAALARRLDARARLHARFATATISLGEARYDLATSRSERYRQPGALPAVEPAPIEADLARRDFTINAIAAPLDAPGELIDPWAGSDDLAARRLRALHEGSFRDDPTRAMRAARYAARLGFALEPSTGALLRASDLTLVSSDRVESELRRFAAEPDPVAPLRLLVDWRLAEADLELAETALGLLRRPPWRGLIEPAAALPRASRVRVGRFRAPEPDRARALASLPAGPPSRLVAAARGADPVELLIARALGARWTERYVGEWSQLRPALRGDDLISAGIEPGPAIGRGLEAALAAQLDEGISDRARQLEIALAAAVER